MKTLLQNRLVVILILVTVSYFIGLISLSTFFISYERKENVKEYSAIMKYAVNAGFFELETDLSNTLSTEIKREQDMLINPNNILLDADVIANIRAQAINQLPSNPFARGFSKDANGYLFAYAAYEIPELSYGRVPSPMVMIKVISFQQFLRNINSINTEHEIVFGNTPEIFHYNLYNGINYDDILGYINFKINTGYNILCMLPMIFSIYVVIILVVLVLYKVLTHRSLLHF